MSIEYIIATKYAKALLALAQERNEAQRVQADLELVTAYFSQKAGQELLGHPLLPLEKKIRMVKEILGDRVLPITLSLLQLLLKKRRGILIREIALVYKKEWLAQQNRKIATVTSAIPLSAEQMKRLQLGLSTLYENEIELQQVVDPQLQAGVRVELDDILLDGTLQGRLARLRRTLRFEN